MRKTLLQRYSDLRESGSSTDFPNLLANVMYKILIDKFQGVNSAWKQWTWQTDLNDFKTANRVLVGEAPDLLDVVEDGQYTDSKLDDYNYQIALKTFGRTFTVGRQTIINDDLQALKRQPERFGRSAARTLAKRCVSAIEGSGNTYDGSELFSLAHGNDQIRTALANTVAGANAVQAAMTVITKATEPSTGEKMGLKPRYLMVCADLEFIGQQLLRSAQMWPVSTAGGGTTNPVGQLELIVEPFLTSTTGWYVMADPQDAPAVEVGFLNGKQTPDLLMKKADAISVAGGGEDPYGYEFDEIFYKVRFDFAVARAMYQGICRGNI